MTQCATPASPNARPLVTQLNSEQINRYKRHLILPEVGVEGQKKLLNAKVLCIGAGGLGCPISLYLAAAGVGTIGLADVDVVSPSNLQRQILFGKKDIGEPKVEAASRRLKDLNPDLNLIEYRTLVNSENVMDLIKDYDIIIDGTDNFPTRYCVGDACVLAKKPNVYGSIFRFEGQASVFWAQRGPCHRCLYPEPPPPGLVPSCAEGGVLGVLPGIIGTIQACETIKLILGGGAPLIGRLLLFDAWKMRFREMKLNKDPDCPVCGKNPTITSLMDYETFCGVKPAGSSAPADEITATELKRLMDLGRDIQLIDVREPHEHAIARIPGSKLVPLGEIVARATELDATRETIIHCKTGNRSARAIVALRAAGFQGRLRNLRGGITAWSEVLPTLPTH